MSEQGYQCKLGLAKVDPAEARQRKARPAWSYLFEDNLNAQFLSRITSGIFQASLIFIWIGLRPRLDIIQPQLVSA